LAFFDAWLEAARNAGIVDALYRYWMLGQIDATRPPRWSIARDVLGWLDSPRFEVPVRGSRPRHSSSAQALEK
jgi:hypothetical protein